MSSIIISNAEGKNVTLRNPDTNMEDIVIDGSDIAKNSDLVNGLSGKADVISANDSQVKTALNATGDAPIYACRAWVNFNGNGTVAIRASGNVSSITDNGPANYTVNFTTSMIDANYSASYQSNINGSVGHKWIGSTTITSVNVINYSSSTGYSDVTLNCVAIFR